MQRSKRIMKITLLALVSALLFSGRCFADTVGENGKVIPSVTLNIPVRHEITGDSYTGREKFTFVLKAYDGAPMPKGAKDGQKTISIRAGKKIDFGDITYDSPGSYFYTVSKKEEEHRYIKEDDTVFSVLVIAFNDGTAKMVINNRYGKVDEVLFEDVCSIPQRIPPRTGDGIKGYRAYMAGGAVSLIALIVMLIKRKREEAGI